MSYLNMISATPPPLLKPRQDITDYWIRYYRKRGGSFKVEFKGRLIAKVLTMEDAWKVIDQHQKSRK